MIAKVLTNILKRLHLPPYRLGKPATKSTNLDITSELMRRGDRHGAVTAFRAYLKTDPHNVSVLNDMATCLADVGDKVGACAAFELAYSLDDKYLPVLINHAKLLVDSHGSADALPLLNQATVVDPNLTHAYAVYAGMCLVHGDATTASYFQLRAWLGNFDNLRLANNYLFFSAFDDMNEANLAAEHRFWAETVIPIAHLQKTTTCSESEAFGESSRPSRKISSKLRIGYWSPDFYNHSVRLFFRPLLENHDRTQVEVFLYYDCPKEDEQTELIRSACDCFRNVFEMSDFDLFDLVNSDQLDVLVELSGHSSQNRIILLTQRFATVQISALGYPPTTGLATIDAKLLDRNLATPDSSRYYSEAPLILPTSFWCFDPMEDVPIAQNQPFIRNGYITFGCVGHIAKIKADVLQCWKTILDRVPNSRLLIRSFSFEDSAAIDSFHKRLVTIGIPLSNVDLRLPEGGGAFFNSYNEIDIILDTFPFNGGTTTCFATYMGVPVVSRAGNSLISRMGLSILTNLGVPELVVHDAKAYTECAVGLANNTAFLRQFRRDARKRFQATALGDGKLFAREFEDACRELLEQKKAGTFSYQHTIPPLPAEEIVRRAYAVLRYGQTEAAQRIVQHCLHHYPNFGSAHLLVTQMWTSEDRFAKAVEYLLARLSSFTEPEQVSVLIYVTRLHLLLDQNDEAKRILEKLAVTEIEDRFDRHQVDLYRASIIADKPVMQSFHETAKARRFHFLIPCNSMERFESMREQIRTNCYLPKGWDASFQRCDEDEKIATYKAALRFVGADILIFLQKNVVLHNPKFVVEVAKALEDSDMLGFAGATRWSRLDWRVDDFDHKAAGLMVDSSEKAGFVELQLLGVGVESVIKNMAVLDGSLLALIPSRLRDVIFDEDLPGAGLLLEEDWSHSAFKSGLRLVVHRNLGVKLDSGALLNVRNRAEGRVKCAEKFGWDPFAMVRDDNMTLSLAVENPARGVMVCQTFMRGVGAVHQD